eukprot:jgi/Ulvmu1/7778/UM004_0007.1
MQQSNPCARFTQRWARCLSSSRAQRQNLKRRVRCAVNSAAMASVDSPFPTDEAIYNDEKMYDLLTALRSIPAISGASCQPLNAGGSDEGDEELRVVLAHSDQDRDTTLTSQRSVFFHRGSLFTAALGSPLPGDASIISTCPSGGCTVVVKPGTPQTIDLWTQCRKQAHIEVPEELHGSIFNDGFFGMGFTWSACGRYAAYCAERGTNKKEDKESGGQASAAAAKKKPLPKPVKKDSKLKEDWGERHTGKRPPTIFVLDTAENHIWQLAGQLDHTSYGQPQWMPEGGLLMVAWPHQQSVFPHLKLRLGLVACFNRNCSFVLCSAPTAATRAQPGADDAADNAAADAPLAPLTFEPPLQSAMEPRFSPDGATLVFISHEQSCVRKTHSAAASLHRVSWKGVWQQAAQEASASMPQTTVVPIVQAPDSAGAFPGLYSAGLTATMIPTRPWLDGSTLLINTLWGTTVAIVAVSLSGQVERLSPAAATMSIIATSPTRLYAASSSMAVLPSAFALDLPAAARGTPAAGALEGLGPEIQKKWQAAGPLLHGLGLPEDIEALLQDISVTRRMSGENVESVIYRRKSAGDSATPGVLFLHGGPHHAVWDAYSAPLAALLALNVTIVLPNYRGSTGYGEAHLQALPGHAGEMDVKDCYEALQEVVAAGLIDSSRVVVQGGSHGGFLTGHLVGQYPDTFQAAVMRNPVLNMPLMVNVSDIPDWCQVETDGDSVARDGAPQFPPSLEQQRAMHDASPIAHIDKVKTPIMMMLGAKDRRVPYIDGLAYAKGLRCRGKDVEVHIFEEDSHPLDKPATSFVSWLRIISFIRMHIE